MGLLRQGTFTFWASFRSWLPLNPVRITKKCAPFRQRHSQWRFWSEAATSVSETEVRPNSIRNIGIVAHVDAGKTTLTEKILYYAGVSRRVGNVDHGDTVMDYLWEERQRGITIQAAATSVTWQPFPQSKDRKSAVLINIVDTPGHVDFTFEVERSLSVMDGAVVLVDAIAGIQAQTATVWRQTNRYGLPRLIFLNKCDRKEADVSRCLQQIRTSLGGRPVLLTAPVAWNGHVGIVDLRATNHMLLFTGSHGEAVERIAMDAEASVQPLLTVNRNTPLTWSKLATDLREALVETLAEYDDRLCTQYLDGKPVHDDDLSRALRSATLERHVVPVFCGSALRGMGIQPLLDAVEELLPSPEERPARLGEALDGGSTRKIAMNSKDALVAYAFKVQQDLHRGPLTFVRVFSAGATACLQTGSVLKILSTDRVKWHDAVQERVTGVFRVHADHFMPIQHVQTGGIYALSGLKRVRTGDTLVSSDADPISVVRLPPVPVPEPMFSVALARDTGYQRSAQEALIAALQVLVRDDPSLRFHEDERTGELLLSGMGELHLDIACKRLEREFGIKDLHASAPRVALFETVAEPGAGCVSAVNSVQCTLKSHDQMPLSTMDRTVGATRLRASMRVTLHPLPRNESNDGIRLEREVCLCPNLVFRGASPQEGLAPSSREIPASIRDAITDGARAALQRGPRAGLPVVGVRAVIHQISAENPVETALRACAVDAVHDALGRSTVALVEPVMRVEVRLDAVGELASEPDEPTRSDTSVDKQHLYGVVIRDLTSPQRRGQVLGTDASGSVVEALVPLEGLIGYANALRSLTGGRASFEASFCKYERVDEMFAHRLLERN
jgi:elongation factor G